MLLTAAVLAMPAPAAAGAIGAFCNYDAGQRQVTIDLIGQQTAIRVSRDAQGRIQLKGVWCDGEATVSNTDSIVMSGDDAFHEFR